MDFQRAKAKIVHRAAVGGADTRHEFFGSVREAVLRAIEITDKPDRELRMVTLGPFEDDTVSFGKMTWDCRTSTPELLFKLLDRYDDIPPAPTNPENYTAWGEF